MTDNEIIKALECCIKGNQCAYSCPYDDEEDNCNKCTSALTKDALDLINRLKAENTVLFYKLSGVMLFVDKWLEGDELKQDEVNRAATMREKTLQIVEKQQAEIEKWKILANEGKEKVELLEIEKSAMQHRIDEQQAEIERLSDKSDQQVEMMANLGVELNKAQKNDDINLDHIHYLQGELKKYQGIESTIDEFWTGLQQMSMFKGKEKPTLEELLEYIEQVKVDAYKEFAEKLKRKQQEAYIRHVGYENDVVEVQEIDNLLADLTPTLNKLPHHSLCETETYKGEC